MTTTHDPLDAISILGWRVVPMEDFGHRVTIVHDVRVLLIDRRVDRQTAADCVLQRLHGESRYRSQLPEAS